MLIENVELTLAHVGLDHLAEVPLLALFATAQAHHLTAGTGHTLHDVTDADGARLYPGYMWLHLRVPPGRPLERHRVWESISIGVDVKRYGRLLLESTYVLGAPGEIGDSAEAWDTDAFPSMRAASMWVVDGHAGVPRPSSPRDGAIAALPPLAASPRAVEPFRKMRATGTFGHAPNARGSRAPLRYPVRLGRDVAPDHNLMFATYVQVMESAEETLLREELWPAMPGELLLHRRLCEREIFFIDHTGPGEEILADVRIELLPSEESAHGPDRDLVTAGRLAATYELYDARTKKLLTCCRAQKLFCVPRSQATLIADLSRFLAASP
jgi:probable biosynthetic protein (TIGR04098 family)